MTDLGKTCVGLTLLFIFAFLGFKAGLDCGVRMERTRAVKCGVGFWKADEMGQTTFWYKGE